MPSGGGVHSIAYRRAIRPSITSAACSAHGTRSARRPFTTLADRLVLPEHGRCDGFEEHLIGPAGYVLFPLDRGKHLGCKGPRLADTHGLVIADDLPDAFSLMRAAPGRRSRWACRRGYRKRSYRGMSASTRVSVRVSLGMGVLPFRVAVGEPGVRKRFPCNRSGKRKRSYISNIEPHGASAGVQTPRR